MYWFLFHKDETDRRFYDMMYLDRKAIYVIDDYTTYPYLFIIIPLFDWYQRPHPYIVFYLFKPFV